MEDPNRGAVIPARNRDDVCDEIGRAVGSLWQRRSGTRPASVDTEYVGDVVRCTIEQGIPAEVAEGESETTPAPAQGGYDQEAKAAVARLTGRTVVGFIAKRVPDGAPATNAFILEANRTRF